MKMNIEARHRRWLYGISIAGFGVLGVYGLINSEQLAAWGVLAAAICGVALDNVPGSGNDE